MVLYSIILMLQVQFVKILVVAGVVIVVVAIGFVFILLVLRPELLSLLIFDKSIFIVKNAKPSSFLHFMWSLGDDHDQLMMIRKQTFLSLI